MKKKHVILLVILCIAISLLLFRNLRIHNMLMKEARRSREFEEKFKREQAEKEKLEKEEKKNKEAQEEKKYSEVYRAMADKCGLSMYDERKKVMIVPLGSAYDEDTLKDVLKKLKLWRVEYYDKDINKLLVLSKAEGASDTCLMGQEFYIVVPKYKDAEVSLKELELLENGKLNTVGNEFLDGKKFTGPVLVCQNISDIAPNALICIDGEGREIKFSPFVSLKDGELILDDEVYNAYAALDMKVYDKTDYDENLFNEIKSYLYNYD